MQIYALRTLYGHGGYIYKGETKTVDDRRGAKLVAKGYAIEVFGDTAAVPSVREAAEVDAPSATPFGERQTGGQTGEEKPLSLSPEAPQPRKRRSKSRKGDAE